MAGSTLEELKQIVLDFDMDNAEAVAKKAISEGLDGHSKASRLRK